MFNTGAIFLSITDPQLVEFANMESSDLEHQLNGHMKESEKAGSKEICGVCLLLSFPNLFEETPNVESQLLRVVSVAWW